MRCLSMRNSLIPAAVTWAILSLFTHGCAIDAVVTRSGDRLELHVKPGSVSTDATGKTFTTPTADPAGDQASNN